MLLSTGDPAIEQRVAALVGGVGSSVDAVPAGDVLVALRGTGYDLLLASDALLHETVRRIQARWPHPLRPYIVGLAAGDSACREWMEAGADACLGGPLTDEGIHGALSRAVGAGGEVVDGRALEQLRDQQEPGEADLVRELAAMFCADGRQRMEALGEAFSRRDRTAIVRIAHSIKGSASTVGAYRLSRLCAVIERAASEAEPRLFDPWAVLTADVFEQSVAAVMALAG